MSVLSRLSYYLPSIIGGAVIGGVLPAHAFRTNEASMHLPQPQRGSLIVRMYEVAMALMTSHKIADAHTAKRHFATISHISSAESAKQSPQEEAKKRIESLQPGYIQKVLQQNPQVKEPVFDYWKDQIHPDFDQNVTFSGHIENIDNKQVRNKILEGNYVRCKDAITTERSEQDNKSDPIAKYKLTDVILTGTTDCKVCDKFKTKLLQDLAKLAAVDELDPGHINAKTPVLATNPEKKSPLYKRTTLDKLTPEHKKNILGNQFSSCHYRDISQPVARGAKYTDTAAIIVGSRDPEICEHVLYQISSTNENNT